MTKEQFKFIERVTNHWFIRHLFSKDVLDYIGCQFSLESNFGQSRLANVMHNYCGMKKPFKRAYYGVNDSNSGRYDYAMYDSFDRCIIDYCSWVLYNRPTQSDILYLESFKIFLRNSGYCPEKDYIDKINLIYQQLKNYKNEE